MSVQAQINGVHEAHIMQKAIVAECSATNVALIVVDAICEELLLMTGCISMAAAIAPPAMYMTFVLQKALVEAGLRYQGDLHYAECDSH